MFFSLIKSTIDFDILVFLTLPPKKLSGLYSLDREVDILLLKDEGKIFLSTFLKHYLNSGSVFLLILSKDNLLIL